ncbi:MAG: hypothetical protein FK734_10685 [Asgard group archaeon]|nr:hypothetical protein [Asgard group archaeon]
MKIKLNQINFSGALDRDAIMYSGSLGELAWGDPSPGAHSLSSSYHLGNLPENRTIFDNFGHDHSGTSAGKNIIYGNLVGVPSTFTPSAHKTSHQDGGSDEITVNGLSGVLAQPQTPILHATTHEFGGDDEISVHSGSGIAASLQKITSKVNSVTKATTTTINFLSTEHIEINSWDGGPSGLKIAITASNLVAAPSSATSASLAVWADSSGNGIVDTGITIDGSDNIDMNGGNITNVGTVDGVDVSSHASRHISGGVDPVLIENLLTEVSQGQFLQTGLTGSVNGIFLRTYFDEITSENITGTDTILTDQLSYTPVNFESVQLFFNGLQVEQGIDKEYVLTGSGFKEIKWLASTGLANDMDTDDRMIVYYDTIEEPSIIEKLANVSSAKPVSLWHADYGVEVDTNQNVSGWRDQWGTNHMVQATANARPYYVTSGSPYNRNEIEFSTEYLRINDLSETAEANDWVFIFGLDPDSSAINQQLFYSTECPFQIFFSDSSLHMQYVFTGSFSYSNQTITTNNQVLIFNLKGGTDTSKVIRDRVELSSPSWDYVASVLTGSSYLGGQQTFQNYIGNIVFFAIYKGSFSDSDLEYITNIACEEMQVS